MFMFRTMLVFVLIMSAGVVRASTFSYDFVGSESVGGGVVNGQVSFHYPAEVTPDTTPRADLNAIVMGGPQDGRQVILEDIATRISQISSGEGLLGLFGRDSFLLYGLPRTGPGQIVDASGFYAGFVWIGNPPVGNQSVPATRYALSELNFIGPAAIPLPTSLSMILLAIGSLATLPALRRSRTHRVISAV